MSAPRTRPMHIDGVSIARAIDAAVEGGPTGAGTGAAANVAHVVATAVVTPANVAYTQADQTALANVVIDTRTKLNAVIDALISAGLMDAS